MKRRYFTIISAMSVLLCAASVALWVRSYHLSDPFAATSDGAFYCGDTGHGHIWLAVTEAPGTRSFYHESVRPARFILTPPGLMGHLGFFYDDRRSADGSARLSLVFPFWLPALATIVVPSCWFVGFLRHRRQKMIGRCVRCGYSLTGNVSGICPECGTHVQALLIGPTRQISI